MAVAEDEDLVHASGAHRALAVLFNLEQVLAPDDGYIAEVLDLSAREFEAEEFASACVKFGGGAEDVGLMLPVLFAGADDERVGRHELFEGLDVTVEPGAPDGFANFEQG